MFHKRGSGSGKLIVTISAVSLVAAVIIVGFTGVGVGVLGEGMPANKRSHKTIFGLLMRSFPRMNVRTTAGCRGIHSSLWLSK